MDPSETMYGPSVDVEKKSKTKEDPHVNKLLKAVSDIESRLRVLEERYANLRHRTQITDQNMLETEKNLSTEMRQTKDQLTQLSDTLSEITSKMGLFASELSTVAQRVDLKVIEKYLDLWQPMQFVTRDELASVLKNWPQKD